MKSHDERLETRHIRSLRKEIIKLRKEIAQLRKKNMRLETELSYSSYDDEEEMEVVTVNDELTQGPNRFECPDCGSYDTNTFSAGAFDFYACDGCGSKGRKRDRAG